MFLLCIKLYTLEVQNKPSSQMHVEHHKIDQMLGRRDNNSKF